ncbi:MAG: alternative ribosome rescue aminoacyl-tRNA hydrolase ArfB [Nitriliruptoraceae bacterium]
MRINRRVVIPGSELIVRAVRSSGPGGQGVNTTDSRVELRWSVRDSAVLTDAERARLLERLAPRLTTDGVLILRADEHRSQHRNRDAARVRLRAIVGEAIEEPTSRRATRPSRSARRRRLESKRRRGEVKRLRRRPAD